MDEEAGVSLNSDLVFRRYLEEDDDDYLILSWKEALVDERGEVSLASDLVL